MTNALTGDYEAVFEIAIPQLNGLLGSRKAPSSSLCFRIIRRVCLVADSGNHKCAMTSDTKRSTLKLMAEWLILLLLVPAIVAPVVLVLGFAGCGFHGSAVLLEPTIDSTTGTSFNTISVAWGIADSASVTFQRTNLDNSVTNLGVQATSPFIDTVPIPTQSPALVYQYQAANDATNPLEWSTAVSGKTFESTFDGMLVPTIEGTGAEGMTQVQRIESGYPLTKNGTLVQILLQADAVSGASIEAIYISQADPNQPMQPWQPATDLTQVPLPATPFIIPPGGSVVALAPVAYNLDMTKPLLIALNYSASPASGVKASNPLPITRAAVYYKPGAEAGLQTRSAGYNLITTGDPTLSAINLIANIYVFVG